MKGPLQSLGIFVISIVVLLVIEIAGNINTHKAIGLGVLHYKGYVLMGVGVLYLIFGAVLATLRVAIR